nr:hypothetical protein GCM10020093_076390 [Planobispora longispora]
MHRRLLVVLVPLAVLLVTALGVPLGVTVAEREMQETYVDRLNDVGRFASLAETALSTGRTEALHRELARYHELYGIPVAVIDTSGTVLLGPAGAYREAARAEPASPDRDRGAGRGEAGAVRQMGAVGRLRARGRRAGGPGQRGRRRRRDDLGPVEDSPSHPRAMGPARRARAAAADRTGGRRLAGVGVGAAAGAGAGRGELADLTGRPHDPGGRRGGPVELRRLSESFNTMMDAVENAVRRQRAFVSDASHQLRNPLTSLRLAVESLEPHLSPVGGGRQVYDVAVDELKAMQRLLNSLQASARMESIRTASPVDLDAVLATRVDRWRALTAAAGQTLVVDVPPGLRLMEPTGGLGSILDELISNALRLSDARVVEVTARVAPDGTAAAGHGGAAPGTAAARPPRPAA